MLKLLTSPFLLRRLIRSQERIATALEVIATNVRSESRGIDTSTEHYPEEEDDIIYSTDEDTFFRQLRDSTRTQTPREED